MWEEGRIRSVESWAGACGKVRKLEWLGDMAFVWRGIGTLVEVAENTSRDQQGSKINR